jgi:hypothetical protein
MNKGERGNARGVVNRPINQPRISQPKTAQPKAFQPVPHINQHSVHMQRVAQAKMAQTRPGPQRMTQLPKAMQLKRPSGPVATGVVQRSECLSGVIESVKSCWNNLPSCCPTPRRDQYTEISDITSSASTSSGSMTSGSKVVTPMLKSTLVDEEDTQPNLTYPRSVHGGYISSCALVIFCFDDSFDCYHAKGGGYKTNHRLRSNPDRIYYIYKVEINDTENTIEDYRLNANRFRQLAGNRAPMEFFGQTGTNGNVMVDVLSSGQIRPTLGKFI